MLNGTTAISTNDLWAVGAYTATGGITETTLIVHGNGTIWSYVPSPNPPSRTAALQGVAGVASNDVWAVGYYYNGSTYLTLTEHWNGTQWSIVPSPNAGINRLFAVTAIASNDVWAVGRIGENDFPHDYALAMHWDGTSWSLVPTPNVTGTPLYGVAAVSTNDVWAVGGGYTTFPTYGQGVIEHWNGSAWSIVSTPPTGSYALHAVTVVSANDVWAVGHQCCGLHSLTEHWDGSAWSIVPSPNPGATMNTLYGVSARASNDVWAVGGTDQASGGMKTFALHWNGSGWFQVATPDDPSGQGQFYAVVTPGGAGGPVWAVGQMGCTSGCAHNALIARATPACLTPVPTWTPTATNTATPACGLDWRGVSGPNIQSGWLNAVSVVSANDIWAVGAYYPNGYMQALFEHWNGAQWSILPFDPSPGNPSFGFTVAAVSSNDVWAVATGGFIHWDGSSWTHVSSPGPGYQVGMAALASNNVWAVGYQESGNTSTTLIKHWDGTQWSVVPSPNPTATYSDLYGVTAVTANNIWAVGRSYNGTDWLTLIEHWDGTQWIIVPSPGMGDLESVAAVTANDIWAVGDTPGNGSLQTLTEHWNGSSWSIVPSPNPRPSEGNRLLGVAAVATNDVWAVGWSSPYSNPGETLIEHWNGTQWSAQPNPPVGVSFYGVAAVTANNVWAVGGIIGRYNDPCPGTGTPTVTATRTRTSTPTASPTACANAIQNGGFETGAFSPWVPDSFNPPPEIVTSPHHTGAYAAKVGSLIGPEPTGDSSFYQQFTVPSGGGTLTFWFYPSCACGSINSDYQDAYITDLNGNILVTLMHVEIDDQGWEARSYDMSAFAGQTVRVKFLVHEDGFGNNTVMFVDDVQMLTACPTGTPPTATRTSTPSPTPTPCGNIIQNGDFETGYIYPWVVDGSNNPPVVTTSSHHSGFFSVQVGTVIGPEPNGDSSLYQQIVVPAAGGTLSYWWNGGTGTGVTFDWQDVYVTDTSGNILATIMHVSQTTGGWVNHTYNMAAFAGQTVRIKFLVHEDGFGDDTYMYVDDVALLAAGPCPTSTPLTATPTATSTVTPCVPYWSRDVFYPIPIMSEAVAAQDGVLYSFGGYSGSSNIVSNAYKFDGNRWTSIAPLPGPRADADALSDGQYIYVLNGYDSITHAVNTLYRYDPVSDTYTQLASPVYATAEQGAALLGGTIYRIGGCLSGCAYTATVEAYTIATNSWRSVAPYPFPAFGLMAVAGDGYVYAGGGRFITPPFMTGQTFRYDPASDTWSDQAIADLPTAWADSASAWLDGQWIIAGTSGTSAAAVAWDPATNTWHALPPPPEERTYTSGAVIGPAFYMVGGGLEAMDNLRYQDVVCTTATVTVTPTSPPVSTSISTHTSTPRPTNTPGGPTNTPATTATSCPIQFTDVPQGSTFYSYVRCLACRGIVSGYDDGTFRPDNNVTRGQLSKIVSNAAGFSDPQTVQVFQDVPPGSTFFNYIGRLASRGYINGYACGGPGESCVPPADLPYFRQYNNATRGQITKIVANAAGFLDPPVGQTFEDVSPGSTFYTYTQRLASRGVMQGYQCGGAGEPCIPPDNRPYFRPFNNATRGQTSKIVSNTFFPDCDTPSK